MTETRVIIAAAGHQDKWGGYLGVPSHLAPIDGEPLLTRTIRQALTVTDEVYLTYPTGNLAYPAAQPWDGAVFLNERSITEPSEYRATRSLWNYSGRTILLLGDCYFTDAAIDRIAGFSARKFQGFGRKGASRVTGCRYGEMFAASWWPEQHMQMDKYLAQIEALRAAGTITRPTGWMLLRAWQGTPLNKHKCDEKWMTTIDDETEDWDFPVDYDTHPAVKRQTQAKAAGKGHAVRSQDLGGLLKTLGIEPRHVVHVGAHEGEEMPIYRDAGFKKITLVEPNYDLIYPLNVRFPEADVIYAACGPVAGEQKLHLMDKTNMATLIEPGADEKVTATRTVPVVTLESFAYDANVCVIDAQGYELEVLRGADLSRYDMVVVETSTVPDPTMASGYAEVTEHMRQNGFEVHEYWVRDYQWLVKWARNRRVNTPGEVRDVVYVRSTC